MPLISFVLATLAASQREFFSPVIAPAQRASPALATQLGQTSWAHPSQRQAWAQIDSTDTGAARGTSWIWGALVLAVGAAYVRPTAAGPGSTVADQLAAELAHHEHNAALTRLSMLAASGESPDLIQQVKDWFQSLTGSKEETPPAAPEEAPEEAPEAPEEATDATEEAPISMLALSGENPDFLQQVKDWFQSLTGSKEETPPAAPEEAPEEAPEAPEEATDATEETQISMLALSGKPRANVKMDLGTDAKDFFEKVTSFFENLTPKEEKKEEAPAAPEDTEVTEVTDTEPTEADPEK